MTGPVRVVIVDDDPLVRSGLELMLAGSDAIAVVGTARDGQEVPAAVRRHRPHVVLMDIRMPGVDGITATAGLRRGHDPPAVVVLTTFDGDDEVLHALHAGAAGFLLKDTPPERIVAAVRAAATGEPVLSPGVTRRLMDRAAGDVEQRDRARVALAELTDREREVAQEIASGCSNHEIAVHLHMSVATVKSHVSSILHQLHLANRTEIALLAARAR